jgi:CDP-diacylglycerol--glycerol-3-phosphate 3-phosphatidyltransferase/cardiolipin synthase
LIRGLLRVVTLANKITLIRIALIPVFVGALMYYQDSYNDGAIDETYRWIAVVTFLVASLSDALDGFIARRFNQRSRLGAILDPLADKGLLISALIALSWLDVTELYRIPIWFLVLVLSRDIVLVAGYCVLHLHGAAVKITPHWSGKATTCCMMAALSGILLKLPMDWCQALVILCGVFTIISIAIYLRWGIPMFNSLYSDPDLSGGKVE